MKVKVPDIEHKTLCYQQKLKPPGAMRRCTFLKNHIPKDVHSWGKETKDAKISPLE